MLYGRSKLLLLSQSGFKRLLPASLLINIISTYTNLLQHFIFARFLLIGDYEKCGLRKEPVIGCSFKHIFFESLTNKFHYHLEQFA